MSDWTDEARSQGWHPIEDCPGALKVGAANTRAERAEGLLAEAVGFLRDVHPDGETGVWTPSAQRVRAARAFLAALDGTKETPSHE